MSEPLVDKLSVASAPMQRKALGVACEAAVVMSELKHPLVLVALAAVEQGHCPSVDQKEGLETLAGQLDRSYWTMEEDRQTVGAEALRLFAQARTASALAFAAHPDPFTAATEAIYEALHATGDPGELVELIQNLLDQ